MAVHSGGGDLEIKIDPADMSKLLRDVRAFDANLSKALRKQLRLAAVPAVKDVQARLMGRTFKTDAGLARGLAAGTKVSIRGGKRNAGVSIVTTGAKLPAAKQAMVQAFNMPSFRHHVFQRAGVKNVWVAQSGRPYFGSILNARKRDMEAAVVRALEDAAKTIRSGTVS